MTTKSIKITYDLHPPQSILSTSNLQTQKSQEFTFPAPSTNSNTQEYYVSLRTAISTAKNEIGEDLTAWRDLVGKTELNKESKKVEDDEEEELDEEQV